MKRASIVLVALVAGCGGGGNGGGSGPSQDDFSLVITHNARFNDGSTVRWGALPITVALNGIATADEVTAWTGATGGRVTFTFGSGGAGITMRFGGGEGICGTTTVTYGPSTAHHDPAWGTFGHPVHPVVTAVTESDGRTAPTPSSYLYRGELYDRVERRSLGFRLSRLMRPTLSGQLSGGPFTDTYFKQDYGSESKPEVVNEYDEADPPVREQDWTKHILASGTFALQGHDPGSETHDRKVLVKPLP